MLADQTAWIGSEQTWLLWSIILAGVALSIHMEQKYAWAARLSGPVIGLLIAMTLSSAGIMPTVSPVYDFVSDYLIPMAIPLLLLQANVFRIIKVTGKMFLAFHVSVVGTFVGAVIATLIMSDRMTHAAEIGGIMTASYSGGSVNFAAVKNTFASIDHETTNPLLVADNFVMAGMFMVLLLIASSRFFLAWFPHPSIRETTREGSVAAAAAHWAPKAIGLRDIATALAIAFAIATAADAIANHFGGVFDAGMGRALLGNQYVWITVISLAVATALPGPLAKVRGAEELGSYALYIYLFTIGLPANLLVVLGTVPEMFLYCGIMAVINLAVTLSVGKMLRLDLEDLLISVNATLGGPPSAVAMTVSKGWSKLVLPAMLVGIWGYVIGTALGVATAQMLKGITG